MIKLPLKRPVISPFRDALFLPCKKVIFDELLMFDNAYISRQKMEKLFKKANNRESKPALKRRLIYIYFLIRMQSQY